MSGVLDGNFYPADGSAFSVPKDQTTEETKEESDFYNALPLLNDMIKRYNKRINFYRSTESIPDEVKTDPVAFMHIVTSNELTAKCLEQERTYIQNLISEYKL